MPTIAESLQTATQAVTDNAAAFLAAALSVAQRETAIVQTAGLTANPNDAAEVAAALARGMWLGNLGSNPNALVGTIGGATPGAFAVLTGLPAWVRMRGMVQQTNTSRSVTMTVNGIGSPNVPVTGPLYKRDGSSLEIGDLKTDIPVEFIYDGIGNFRLLTTLASDGKATVVSAFTGQLFFVDPVNGSDTDPLRDGLTIGRAYQSIERAFRAGQLGTNVVVLLGDTRWTRRVDLVSNWVISGAAATDTNVGYTSQARNLFFSGEAVNSPYGAQGRIPAGANFYAGSLTFGRINAYLPNIPSALPTQSLFQMLGGGSLAIDTGSIQLEAGSTGGFLMGQAPVQSGLYLPGSSLGSGVPGRVLQNIAAGANPNASPFYRSNLTSA